MPDIISAFVAGMTFVMVPLAMSHKEAGWAVFFTLFCLFNIVAALT